MREGEREKSVNKIVFFFIQPVNSEVAYMQPHCSGLGKYFRFSNWYGPQF